jgi:UDP-N-acetylmuramoylalanine--D-glutamate ligase
MSTGLKVIVGLGKTGLSCLRYLVKKGFNVAVTDSRENPPGLIELKTEFPHIAYYVGKFSEQLCMQAQELIVSPGVSLHEPALANAIASGIPVIGDIELFARLVKAPVIGITGSNGKSTVTTLVGEMAKASGLCVKIGGNLGTPALDLLDDNTDLYILELSSFQLETTYSLALQAATILNISEDHMDRYSNLAEYLQAKQRIFQHCALAIVNRDDPYTWENLHFSQTPISFGLTTPAKHEFGVRQQHLAQGETLLLPTADLKIKGRHQLMNALAALALGHAVNLPMANMLTTLCQFSGLAHRCQWVATYHDISWYNDSKATNVGAAQAAITGLGTEIKGKLVLIAGGLGKNADFSPLTLSIQKYVRAVILIGQDAAQIAKILPSLTTIYYATDMEHAVQIAQAIAQMHDAVLLAPACASYDMFNDFEHRGDVFMQAVRNLT